MSTSDSSDPPLQGIQLAPGEILCPRCRLPVKEDTLGVHLARKCRRPKAPGTGAAQSAMRTGMFAEYEEERQRDRIISTDKGIYNIGSPRQYVRRRPDLAWMTCPRCGDEIKRSHQSKHPCPGHRLYVQHSSQFGISGADFVSRVEEVVRRMPGRTAWSLANALGSINGRAVDKSIVNSVLYSFRGTRFYRIPEGEEFEDEIKPPLWYHM